MAQSRTHTRLTEEGRRSAGSPWDDGPNYYGVRQVFLALSNNEITQIMIYYDKGGVVEARSHGECAGRHEKFVVDFPAEYIISVEGTSNSNTLNRVSSLVFKTSKGRTSPIFGKVEARAWVLENKGEALIGFHGRTSNCLEAIGAYFAPQGRIPTRLRYEGRSAGNLWDDGYNYDGVRKVSFSLSGKEINQIRTDYDKGGLVETRSNGVDVGRHEEFVLDYPAEYLIRVEGTYDQNFDAIGVKTLCRLRSLVFKTSKGRTSPIFGNVDVMKFVLENKGDALIGFHGRVTDCVEAIGAYFLSPVVPSPPPSHAEKLQAKGGEGGNQWDDGVFNGLREISVGQGISGVAAVKFIYEKDSKVADEKEHGTPTQLDYEKEFKIDYPSEYIIAVEGCFDKIYGSEGGVVTMLKFKTNKKTSPPFGLETASTFTLGKEGYKIVGFHGSSSHELHKIGAHVVPITQ